MSRIYVDELQTKHGNQMEMNQVPIPLNCFKDRYTVRSPVLEDLPELVRLEKACWPLGLRSTDQDLRLRIEGYAENHSVLIIDKHIVGAVYTQRIRDIADLNRHTYRSVSSLRTRDGSVLQLLSINVIPSMLYLGYGDQLLEFMLLASALKTGIEKVVAVVQCREYINHAGIGIRDYISMCNTNGEPVDSVLAFHARHGAKIEGILSDYRPADRENNGHGVLVSYDIHHRKPPVINSLLLPDEKPVTGLSDLADTVTDAVRFILNDKNRSESFNPKASFHDMGMNGLDLFGLQMILARKLNTEISPTLFYKYSSPAGIIDYFSRRLFPDDPVAPDPDILKTVSIPVRKTELPDDAVAVVGMACRFPGAEDIDEYWDLLYHGRDAITQVPSDRWDRDRFCGTDKKEAGKISSSLGGYLTDVAKFDARFFGMSPREARQVDPQQRLLLELNRDALEFGGIAPDAVKETRTGIFVGIFTNDYQLLQLRQNDWSDYDMYFNTGNSPSTAAGRLAYTLGCRGPAICLNTACSSSLVAVHMACQSLQQGECDLALGSGVNLILSPEVSIGFSQAGMLSPDGRCKTFDASANGYVRSEGAGVLVLKRLKDALQDHHTIYGIIKGSAVNQDGASNGLTAPNGLAQAGLIRDVLSRADLSPDDISYVETHGTATALGDPIEYEALLEVFGRHRPKDRPLVIGSVKTNIGHTESAAGMAGMIKVLLSMQHRYIPAHLNFTEPNSLIDLKALPALVPTRGMVFPGLEHPFCAGVSSFGFSGTNAHVIVQEFKKPQLKQTEKMQKGGILTLSARNEAALAAMAGKYVDFLDLRPGMDVADICYTSHVGRTHFDHRLAVCAMDIRDLSVQLRTAQLGQKARGVSFGCKTKSTVAFLFTGQGSQYVNMGRELYQDEPVFRDTLDRCADILLEHMERPLLKLIFLDDKLSNDRASLELNQTMNAQPVLFALEYALVKVWEARGIEPDIMMGHSVGEYVAACLAGVFSLEDALRLIAARGRLMQNLPAGGGMVALLGNVRDVEIALKKFDGRLDIAAYNSPENIVVSGSRDQVARFSNIMESKGVKAVPLNVSHAFHSFLMEPMLAEFKAVADTIPFNLPRKKLVSNVHGAIAATQMASPDYWVDHVRQPVQFARGVQCLVQEGAALFLEVGPKPVLSVMAGQCLSDIPGKAPVFAAGLVPGIPDAQAMDHSLAALYAGGADIDWDAYHQGGGCQRIALPTYPYQRERFWIKTGAGGAKPFDAMTGGHPLLGSSLATPLKEKIFTAAIGTGRTRYLQDHRVGGRAILPASGYLEIALAAARKLWGKTSLTVSDLLIRTPLVLPEDGTCRIQTIVSPPDGSDSRLTVYLQKKLKKDLQKENRMDSQWEHLVSLSLSSECDSPIPPVVDAGEFKQLLVNPNPAVKGFGPCFTGLVKFGRSDSVAVGQICLPAPLQKQDVGDAYVFHPSLMDACFQTAATALVSGKGNEPAKEQSLILMGIDRFEMFATPSNALWCRVGLPLENGRETEIFSVDLMIYNPDGSPVASARGLNFRKVGVADMVEGPGADIGFYEVAWHPEPSCGMRHLSAMPSPGHIKDRVLLSAKDPNSAQPVRFLEELSRHYIRAAFAQLGWTPVPDESFTTRELISRLNIASRHHRLMERLLEILAGAGIICRRNSSWQTINPGTPPGGEFLFDDHPEIQSELTLLERFGSNLALVLKGECDPLTLLFPEADLSNAVRLYEESLAFGAINQVVGKTAAQIVKQIPPERELRILELGAGTGGTTAHLLPVLEGRPVRYTFTDVTRIFTRKAKDRFARYPFVEYRLLDIEKDPLSQGYAAGKFDIVLAANVLHATADLSVTLKHVRNLLAPGGLLLLVEGTAARGWIDLIFGVIEGWWKFQDHRHRPDYPLMPAAQWKAVLKENGFQEPVDITPVPVDEALFPQSIIMAKTGDDPALPEVRTSHRHWLVFEDQGKVGDTVAPGILQPGDAVTRVYYEDQEDQQDGGMILDYQDPEQFKSLLSRIPDVTHILYLWGLDARTHEQMDAGGLARHMHLTCGSLLYLVQALAADPPPGLDGLSIITAGGQPVDFNVSIHPSMAPLWGMGDVIRNEHPELNCRIIDMEPPAGDEDFSSLSFLLTDPEAFPKAAIRNGRILVPWLVKKQVPMQTYPATEPDGTVLITGGMGGIGLSLARHLVKKGFRHLVLLGRQSPESKTQRVIDDLVSQGAVVTVMTGDVADFGMLASVFDRIKTDLPPLKGVVHTAGVVADSLLGEHTWDRFERVFAAKVQGSWNLHTLTREYELDFFVLFSSAMTFLPNPGLSNYVAANAFMDLLAHYRQHLGLPGVSIAWGPWKDVGMASAVGVKRRDQWAAFGFEPLDEHTALEAFDRLIQPMEILASVHTGVMSLDWETFDRHFSGSVPPFHAGLIPSGKADMEVGLQKTPDTTLLDMLAQMMPENRQVALEKWLQELAAGVMGFDQVEQLDMEDGFFQQGMDSLTAVELRGRLQRELKRNLPATAIFKYPTVVQLGDYIAQNFLDHVIPRAEKSDGALKTPEDRFSGESQTDEKPLDVPALSETDLDGSVETELIELERLLDLNE